jgi:hypothetical protein
VTVSGFGLSQADLDRETGRFGVADEQVRRDHAISHVLAGISKDLRNDVMFFGGTALSRTHLISARLSEDIDLVALGNRAETAERLTDGISSALLRTHGRVSWAPAFTANDTEPAIVETPTGIAIRVQLLAGQGYQPWPTELRDIEQRYSDVPSATLIVPTIESFVGWKATAWHDRGRRFDHSRSRRPLREARTNSYPAARVHARQGADRDGMAGLSVCANTPRCDGG